MENVVVIIFYAYLNVFFFLVMFVLEFTSAVIKLYIRL